MDYAEEKPKPFSPKFCVLCKQNKTEYNTLESLGSPTCHPTPKLDRWYFYLDLWIKRKKFDERLLDEVPEEMSFE